MKELKCDFRDANEECYLIKGHEGLHEMFTQEEVNKILESAKGVISPFKYKGSFE